MHVTLKLVRRLLPTVLAGAMLLAGTSAMPANAQGSAPTVGTSYKVSGTNPDGSTYTGTLAIKPSSGKTDVGAAYELNWTINKSSDRGLGVFHDGVLSVVFGMDGCGMYVFKQSSSGLTGTWANIADQQFGTEDVTGDTSGSNTDPFSTGGSIKGTNPDGSTYSGNVKVQVTGLLSKWTWDLKGTPYGTGITEPDSAGTFVIGYQYKDTDKCAVMSLTVVSGAMFGVWANTGDSKGIGSEFAVSS